MSDAYLNLLRDALTGVLIQDPPKQAVRIGTVAVTNYIAKIREYGRDIPSLGLTMIGTRRMNNIRSCIETLLREDVPGDFMEAGVWRGGACIYMRGVLKAYGVTDRHVWVADSFEGMPKVDVSSSPLDASWAESAGGIAVPVDEVRANFQRFGLLDAQVHFLKGWFAESLPNAPVAALALLRLDCDLYRSTLDVLEAMYDRVSPGGFVIVDDYEWKSCSTAIAEFRAVRNITAPLQDIDGAGVFWRKEER